MSGVHQEGIRYGASAEQHATSHARAANEREFDSLFYTSQYHFGLNDGTFLDAIVRGFHSRNPEQGCLHGDETQWMFADHDIETNVLVVQVLQILYVQCARAGTSVDLGLDLGDSPIGKLNHLAPTNNKWLDGGFGGLSHNVRLINFVGFIYEQVRSKIRSEPLMQGVVVKCFNRSLQPFYGLP